MSVVGSLPTSSNKIFQFGFSDNLLAITEPAGPDPTIMKSYSSSGFGFVGCASVTLDLIHFIIFFVLKVYFINVLFCSLQVSSF